jgi:hypothetical protein
MVYLMAVFETFKSSTAREVQFNPCSLSFPTFWPVVDSVVKSGADNSGCDPEGRAILTELETSYRAVRQIKIL